MSLLQGKSRAKTGRRIVIDLQKAERALKDGHHKEVEQLCTEILEERPDSFQACQLISELRVKQGRFEEAMRWVERAQGIEPDNPRSLNILGGLLERQGELGGAEAALRKALEQQPGYADAHANLGQLLLRTGRTFEAEKHFRHAIEHDREHGLANLSLGKMLYDQRHPDLAVPHLQTGIQRELTHRTGQHTLAVALHELGRFDEAVTAYRCLVAAGDENPDVFSGLADALVAMGELEVAMAGYEAALELQPGHPAAAAGLAGVLTARGRAPEALELLAPLVDRGDAAGCLHVAHARALVASGRRNEALLHLADMVKRPLGGEDLAPAHRLLGELLDGLGEHERAFAQHRRVNGLRARRYDAIAHEALVARIIAAFTRQVMDGLPRGSGSDIPVFIVGMPCSGAEVIERTIAAHSRAASAGALLHLDLGAGRIGRYNNAGAAFPECISGLRERELRELSAAYLGRLFAAGERARRIVDSMWLNFIHLGLVELMFPQARVIHLRRAPLDVGLGCYFHSFGTPAEAFSGELSDFGHFYAQYRRLMAHWRETSQLAMHEVDFESLSAQPEDKARRLIEFLGLAWEPECLEQGVVPGLASARPAGWSGRYERHLGPLRESLAVAGYPQG
jgi:tetratricopeptide (TPR) repeat protein